MKGLAEEKVIIDYVESGCASSVDNVETDKRRYADISSTQMSKKKTISIRLLESDIERIKDKSLKD
jgi:predicted DNA binding CopG/RHH family protein